MRIRTKFMTGILASTLAISGGMAVAQDASPETSPVPDEVLVSIMTTDGDEIATASFVDTEEGVAIAVSASEDSGLEPGEHGIHIHSSGQCEPPFESAAGHFNPTDATHGGAEDDESHAGDLGNLTVEDDGTFQFELTTDKISLQGDEETSIADEDGSALVIHAAADDLETDPSGESGDRLACGVIFPSQESGTPVATPQDSATPESTPQG